jgi:hypothetical protein
MGNTGAVDAYDVASRRWHVALLDHGAPTAEALLAQTELDSHATGTGCDGDDVVTGRTQKYATPTRAPRYRYRPHWRSMVHDRPPYQPAMARWHAYARAMADGSTSR